MSVMAIQNRSYFMKISCVQNNEKHFTSSFGATFINKVADFILNISFLLLNLK